VIVTSISIGVSIEQRRQGLTEEKAVTRTDQDATEAGFLRKASSSRVGMGQFVYFRQRHTIALEPLDIQSRWSFGIADRTMRQRTCVPQL